MNPGGRWWVAMAALLFSIAAPIAPAFGEAPQPAPPLPPPSPPVTHELRYNFLVGGWVLFGATWVPAVIISARSSSGCDTPGCRDGAGTLWVPVLGPFLAMSSNVQSSRKPLLAVWSLAEAGGLVMIAVGLVGHDVPAVQQTPQPSWGLAPIASRDLTGLVLHATF
jgi:hypothetical protein